MIIPCLALLQLAQKAAEKAARDKVPPQEIFKQQTVEQQDNGTCTSTPKYSQFDADGVPTHDAAGAEVSA